MLYFLNPNLLLITLLHSLFHQIFSISGTETFVLDDSEPKVDINNICPCDKTVGTCDIGCLCDQNCFDLMLSYKLSSSFFDFIDSSSYTDKNLDSKLDYCDEYTPSLDDLYNPLILAFKILKKGFCLVKSNKRKDDDNNGSNPTDGNDTGGDTNDGIDYGTNIYDKNNDINNLTFLDGNFSSSRILAPVALPNGLCLFHSHQIRKNIDYEVTCSYHLSHRNNIIRQLLGENIINPNIQQTDYYIHNSYYFNTQQDSQNIYIKKIEIFYYDDSQEEIRCKINNYYDIFENHDIIKDLTVDVKFFNNTNDFKKSGNYGYIKGKPINILTSTMGDDNEIKLNLFLNGAIYPLQGETNTVYNIMDNLSDEEIEQINDKVYYDNYIDNKITLEDLIIYGYERPTNYNSETGILRILKKVYNNKNISYYGNASNSNPIKGTNNNINNFVIIGKYKDSGAVNNTQYKIVDFEISDDTKITAFTKYIYFIIKFIKLETKTKWWYAPGPGIVRVPKNIMYPFKIGTSNYKK